MTVALMWRTEYCQPGVYEREGSLPLILRYDSRSSFSEYRPALKRHEESTCSKRMMCWQDPRRSHVVGHNRVLVMAKLAGFQSLLIGEGF